MKAGKQLKAMSEKIEQIFQENEIKNVYAAARLGVHENTIADYRHGVHYPSVLFIRWLCMEYKVSPYWLLDIGEEDGRKRPNRIYIL